MHPTKRTTVGENPREAGPGPLPHTTLGSGQDEQTLAPVSTWVLRGFRGQRECHPGEQRLSQTRGKDVRSSKLLSSQRNRKPASRHLALSPLSPPTLKQKAKEQTPNPARTWTQISARPWTARCRLGQVKHLTLCISPSS